MLKFECKKCDKWFPLPFHVSSADIYCPECSTLVPNSDVYVTSGPLAVSKDALQKNVHKYKNIIRSAEKEAEELRKKGAARGFEATPDPGAAFAMHLKELLGGCRDNTRHRVEDGMRVKCVLDGVSHAARVVDISLTGVCLEAPQGVLPHPGSKTHLRFIEDDSETVIPAEVAWAGKSGLFGVRFTAMTMEKEGFIRDIILKKCAFDAVKGKD